MDTWLCISSATTRPPPKPKAAPKVVKNISSRPKNKEQNKLIVRKGINNNIVGNSGNDMNDDEDDFIMMEASEPEIPHLQNRDWEKEWNERLDSYKAFIR